jgi:serine/threonine protein kinase
MIFMRGKSLFFWLAIFVGSLLLGALGLQTVNAFRIGRYDNKFGWLAAQRADGWVVYQVEPGGAAAGKLQIGDRLLALDSDERVARIGPYWKIEHAAPGSRYTLDVQRGAEQFRFELTFQVQKNNEKLIWLLLHLLVASAFGATGMLIALYKPDDHTARLGSTVALLTCAFILSVASNPLGGMLNGFSLWVSLALWSVFPFHIAFAYLFTADFPQPVPAVGFRKATKWLILIFAAALWAPTTLVNVLRGMGAETAMSVVSAYPFLIGFHLRHLTPWSSLFLALTAISALVVIRANYRRLPEGDQRRRIRLFGWALFVGCLPVVVVTLTWFLMVALGWRRFIEGWLTPLTQAVNAFVIIIPIAMAYAIIKHRVLGINAVLRLGVQYLLASNVLRAVIFLPLIGLVSVLALNPDKTLRDLLFSGSGRFNLALLGVALLSLRYRSRLMNLIDRRFFREAYQQEQILLELSEQIRQADSLAEISRLLNTEVEKALHSRWVSLLFWAEQTEFFSASGSVKSEHRWRTLGQPVNDHLVSQFEQVKVAQPWRNLRKDCLPAAVEWLDEQDTQLVVPIPGADGKTLGVVLLGEKRSEEPYTKADLNLLHSLVSQVGVIYENLTLKERVRRGKQVEAEVLARLEERRINIVKECPACGVCYDSSAQTCARDGQRLALTLPIERMVDSKYRLERLIGKGGMGAVYEATDLRLNRTVALKAMLGKSFGDASALRRFAREAQLSARLDHPNIVRVYDFGELHGGGAYLVMEYVQGTTWREELGYLGTFPPALAADLIEQTLSGLEAAHRARIVHRDLKPENILIAAPAPDQPLLIKILDFGLAKSRALDFADPKSHTQMGMVMGTLGYMSPEQFHGEEVDERTDIYAVGVMTLETLTGPLGKPGYDFHQQLAALLDARFDFAGATPEHKALARVLAGCLAVNRAERFASVADLRKTLIPLLRRCPPLPASVRPQPGQPYSRVSTLAKTLGLVRSEEKTRLKPEL